MKKLTFEYIKNEVEKVEGYRLLSTEYVNQRTKLQFLCPKNHSYFAVWNSFKIGARCQECYGTKRRTTEEVNRFIEKENHKLISKEYKNSDSLLEIECSKGHLYKMRFSHFKIGQRCPECAGVKKHTFDFVKKHIESIGYKLVSTDYKNNRTHLKIECDRGHVYDAKFNTIASGYRCPHCFGNLKLEFDFVKKQVEDEGYKLLSTEYINCDTKIHIECDKGHRYKVRYYSFLRGDRCSLCYGNKLFTFDFVKNFIESAGYKLLSTEYINSRKNLKIECDKRHSYETSFVLFKSGHRCPRCFGFLTEKKCRSIFESVLLESFPSKKPSFLRLTKTSFLQLDGYSDKLKLAFEYDGEFHYQIIRNRHNNLEKQQERDRIKNELCKLNNVYLIRIPYFVDDKEGFISEEISIWKATISGTNG